jgi:predicted outer membrane repeat protein
MSHGAQDNPLSVSGLPSEEEGRFSAPAPEIEGYQILDKLGEAGQGQVWRAVQLSTQRQVALKVPRIGLLSSKTTLARFEREVKLAARLRHPSIARVFDSGVHRGMYFYTMDLIEGTHLDQYVKDNHTSPRQILELMKVICEAVQHAHQNGVIHRDLKPSNIIVAKDGHPYIVDFGLAKSMPDTEAAATISVDGEAAGTPAYMSPEQAAGHLDKMDARTDVYSLGAILFTLLTGQYPHDLSGSHVEVLHRISEKDVRRPRKANPKIDRDIEALLLKALQRDPGRRYSSAGGLADDIKNYLDGAPLSAGRKHRIHQMARYARRHRLGAAVVVSLSVVGAAVAVALVGRMDVITQRIGWTHDGFQANSKPAGPQYYVDAGARGRNDGSKWMDALDNLQDALAVAKAGDVIWVAQGIYMPDRGEGRTPGDRNASFKLVNGVSIFGGFPSGGGTWAQRNLGRYETILSGDIGVAGDNADNSLHVVMAINCDATTLLDGLTIAYGNASGTITAENRGGGLFNDASSPTLRDCTFRHNAASWFGAGMYNHHNSHSEPNLVHCTFTDNVAGSNGAAIYSHATCNLTLTNCLFQGNTVADGGGAAIQIVRGSATLTDCNFIDNKATVGGALCGTEETECTLVGCTFSGNSAMDDGGAVKYVNGTITLAGCTFIDNGAGTCGGGMSIYGSTAWVVNCTFAGNLAQTAGGVHNEACESEFAGCVFTGNTAQTKGGGLGIWNCTKPTYVGNCTFSRNNATLSGGGIYDSNSVSGTLANSILWGNTATQGPQIALAGGASLTVQRCDVQDGQAKVSVGLGTLNWGMGNITSDPRFIDAAGADNKAGTADDRLDLSDRSPCIDAGDNKLVSADVADLDGDGDVGERLPLDIAGHPRFVDDPAAAKTGAADPPSYTAIVDMGAYERHAEK